MRIGEYTEGPELLPGCLWCDGTELNKYIYDALFASIGYSFGRPSGITFRLPNKPDYMICYDGGWPTPSEMVKSRLDLIKQIYNKMPILDE